MDEKPQETPSVTPIAPGDTVRLKSGSCPLTVSAIGNGGAKCFWHDDQKHHNEAVYPLNTLVRDV